MEENHPITEVLLFQFQYCCGLMHGDRRRREQAFADTTQGQGRTLALLSRHDGISQRDLAEMMMIRPPSLTELLGKLEKSGHVERRENPEDRRVVNVYLTEKSRQAVEDVRKARREMADGIFAAFSEEEQTQFSQLLEKLIDSLKPEGEEHPHDRMHGFDRRRGR